MSAPLPLSLTVLDDGTGGLIFLLGDGRSLALHERIAWPDGGLAAWGGQAWQRAASDATGDADGLLRFGSALARAWLPPSVGAVLSRPGAGWLQLQLDQGLSALPWELAAPDGGDAGDMDGGAGDASTGDASTDDASAGDGGVSQGDGGVSQDGG